MKPILNRKVYRSSIVSSLQVAYNEYRKTQHKIVDSYWIGKDGTICVYSYVEELKAKAEEQGKEVSRLLRLLYDFDREV